MRTVTHARDLEAPTRKRGVVMTMGALHEGHLALVRAARETCDEVVVTIFVNPLQFNDAADLERYPRTLEADAELLRASGVDVLFAPSVAEVYPAGDPIVTVSAGALGTVFEGEFRPGHFDGMLTVVVKLMHLTRPNATFFGEKDAQQLIAVRRMVADLSLGVEVIGVPTVRDADGLALSSRNALLSSSERADALALSRALATVASGLSKGSGLADALAAGRAELAEASGVSLDYLAALDPTSGLPLAANYRGDVVVAVAARVGTTRLIDNVRADVTA